MLTGWVSVCIVDAVGLYNSLRHFHSSALLTFNLQPTILLYMPDVNADNTRSIYSLKRHKCVEKLTTKFYFKDAPKLVGIDPSVPVAFFVGDKCAALPQTHGGKTCLVDPLISIQFFQFRTRKRKIENRWFTAVLKWRYANWEETYKTRSRLEDMCTHLQYIKDVKIIIHEKRMYEKQVGLHFPFFSNFWAFDRPVFCFFSTLRHGISFWFRSFFFSSKENFLKGWFSFVFMSCDDLLSSVALRHKNIRKRRWVVHKT